jgi:hypothetical protein
MPGYICYVYSLLLMLLSERLSVQTGWTCPPHALAPRDSHFPQKKLAPRTVARTHLAPRASRSSRHAPVRLPASRCAPLHLAPHAMHPAPWLTLSAPRASGPTRASRHPHLAQRSPAPRQLASIGRQQIESTCCNRIFHAFQTYVTYVSSRCCKSRSGVAYVAMAILASVCFKCFSCFKRILQLFYLDIAYVAVAIYVCCRCMFQMFHLFRTYIASVSSGCCIGFRHMLQASIQNISSISDMLQMCLSRCCSCYTHMLQTYVCKCFICFRRMFQKCFHIATLAGVGSRCMQMRSPLA